MSDRLLICAALALIVAACTPASTDEAAAKPEEGASTQAIPTVVAAQTRSEPQVGDRVPDRGNNNDSSSRLAAAGAEANALAARGVRELGWEELLPEGEEERLTQLYQQQMMLLYTQPIEEGSSADIAVQIGTFNTVPELNEARIRLPGYTVPFEFGADAKITEFLLVPYYGACLHAPPPPPNQTIFVMTDEPISLRDLAQAVWVEGTMYTQTQESDLADAAYTIKMDRLEIYDY
ncbi:MAG: DUF3299 domain-containing protein [Pseudomonadota bacterium]